MPEKEHIGEIGRRRPWGLVSLVIGTILGTSGIGISLYGAVHENRPHLSIEIMSEIDDRN